MTQPKNPLFMRKNLLNLIFASLVVMSLSGCAMGLVGIIYTDTSLPVAATSNKVGTKVGEAYATSVLGLVATGDAGVNAAAKNGNLTTISHVDMHTMSVLGIYTKVTCYVYGN